MKFSSLGFPLLGSSIFSSDTDTTQYQIQQRENLAFSPPFYPSPWMDPNAHGWAEAYAKAKDFVSQLTLMEKVNLTTGVGLVSASHFPSDIASRVLRRPIQVGR